MKNLFLIIISINIISCAKISYLTSQSLEQVRLISQGEEIKETLKRDDVDLETKDKLKKIIQYKRFFSNYFNENIGEIYNKIIFLDRKHVSYLVVSSSWEEIKPVEECFWLVGCFPYLGFFHKKAALEHKEKMTTMGLSSHIRPVNAYSTLGHFNDRVLTSFFNYSDKGLANLIFHELVHSVIFFKNGVSFNENIANFFADELVSIYFKESIADKQLSGSIQSAQRQINSLISKKTKNINSELTNFKGDKKRRMKELISSNFGQEFALEVTRVCNDNKINTSFCLKYEKNWTPSTLAAIGTYNQMQSQIRTFYKNNFKNLKEFYIYLKAEYLKGTSSKDLFKQLKLKY